MTIKLTDAEQQVLVLGLVDGLRLTKPQSGYISREDFKFVDDLAAKLSSEVRGKIERYLGENGLASFLTSMVYHDMRVEGTSSSFKGDRTLVDHPALADTLTFARKCVDQLTKLPIRYRLTVALPQQFSELIIDQLPPQIDLAQDTMLVKGSCIPFPLDDEHENANIDKFLFSDIFDEHEYKRGIRANRIYFSAPILGFALHSHSSEIGRRFEDSLTAFYGACTAKGLLGYQYHPNTEVLPWMSINTFDGKLIETEKLEDELINVETMLSTAPFAEKNLKVRSAFIDVISKVATVFQDDIDSRKLFTACIWYFRAFHNKRPLDSLLQATIAIEVMLGDQKLAEGVGLTNQLASRCAFLLGRSTEQRRRIEEKFRSIYTLRSLIVHEGRHYLHAGDRAVVSSAKQLCAHIISHELTVRAKNQR